MLVGLVCNCKVVCSPLRPLAQNNILVIKSGMAYREELAQKVRDYFEKKHVVSEEKKMMGGLTFMVDGKMCVGVLGEELMVRIDPQVYDQTLRRKGVKEMTFTGRPMKGFVFVESKGYKDEADFEYVINLGLEYNPKVKLKKKKG